jgi:hypothetical protein
MNEQCALALRDLIKTQYIGVSHAFKAHLRSHRIRSNIITFYQVVGSIYYLLAVGQQKTCWETQCSIKDPDDR